VDSHHKTNLIYWTCSAEGKESSENLVLTGYVEGQRARGRQQLTFLEWLERAKSGIQPTSYRPTQSIETSKRYRLHDWRLRIEILLSTLTDWCLAFDQTYIIPI